MLNNIKDDENYSALTDEALMLRCKKGEIECLNILITRYKNPLFRYIYSMIREEAVSEEIFQDVFLQVFKSRKRYKPKAKFSSFLYKIAHNHSINILKRMKFSKKIDLEIDKEEIKSPLRELLDRERRSIFLDSLSKLPVKIHSAYVLREIEGFNYQKISEIQGCSIGTVKSRISRARNKLCEDLKRYEL